MLNRRVARVVGALFFSLATVLPGAARAGDFFFRDGDRVVMIGDSITEQHLYSSYVEMWTTSRFPTWNITFRNVGIGGDRSPGGNGRFARDVLIHQPTAMTVDFGMNDGGYRAFDEGGYKTYRDGLTGIAEQAAVAGVRVAWLAPSPVEKNEDGPALAGYNETLERYSAGVAEVAAAHGALFVDQFHPFVHIQDQAGAADPKNRIGGGDPVHPGPPGQALMAWAILKGLQFPTLVARVEIDAAANTLAAAENCKVSGLEAGAVAVRFDQLDAALPFFPAEAESINAWAPLRDDLNQYLLKVTGLSAGRYEIRLGGETVAEHSAQELAAGVNLARAALAKGPVAQQVQAVWNAVNNKNRYYHDRIFRGVVLAPVTIPDFLGLDLPPAEIEAKRTSAVAERMSQLPELDAAIHAALSIEPHRVEIVPSPDLRLNGRRVVRCSIAILALAMLTVDARAQDLELDLQDTINRGLSFLAQDSVAWKQSKQCYECHHAPFTIWALNVGRNHGYVVDENVLGDMTSWVVGEDYLGQLIKERPAQEEIVFNEAPLLLALGIEAGNTNDVQEGLKRLLASVVNDQGSDGSWKRVNEARPILSSPDTLTMLALLALSAPNAPDTGHEGKTAQERGLEWLLTAKPDDELQPTVLRLILWRRLGRPDSEWKSLEQQLLSSQNEDGGWSQIKLAGSDAYATGQVLYALAEAGAPNDDDAIRRAQFFLEKTQREDGAWAMTSRAIMGNGKVATKFEPITHAGSAWAVMGLIRTVPAKIKPASAASQ